MWFCPTLPQETLWLHLGCPVQAPHMRGWVVCEVPRQCVPGHWAPRGCCWPVFAQDGGWGKPEASAIWDAQQEKAAPLQGLQKKPWELRRQPRKMLVLLPVNGCARVPNCRWSWVNIWAAQTKPEETAVPQQAQTLYDLNWITPEKVSWSIVQEAEQTAAGHGCTGEGGHQGRYSDGKLCQDVLHNKKAPELPWTQHPQFFPWGGQVRLQQPTCISMAGSCNWKGYLHREHFPENTLCRLTPVISRDGSPWMDLTGEVSASTHSFTWNVAMVNASQCTPILPPPGILHVQWKGSRRMLQKHEESIKSIDFLSDISNFTA